MATVTITKRSDGVNSFAHGSFTGDGSAVTINLGFVPNHFILFNETDAMKWEKFAPMADANSIKTVTAGTQTADANSQIVFNDDGTVTIGTTAAPSAKACKFRASL